MARVVVVGSFNVDHVWTADRLPAGGETLAGRYASGPGGKGFNQATACARAGADTRFVCALGEDVGGQLARALAAADAIDLRDACVPAPTGTAGIFVAADGRNSIVIGPGANAELAPAFVEGQFDAQPVAVVLAQLESPLEAIARALQAGRSQRALTILNPAPANAPTTRELLDRADVLTPNETEFCALLRLHAGVELAPEALAQLDDAGFAAHCRTLAPHATVVVTLGAAGCFVSHAADALRGDAQPRYRVAAERVEVVDTTGAGDAFNGALAASLARAPAEAFASHIGFASRYASLSTERAGAALAMPHRRDVEQRFDAA